jgi:YVTN family beta-propeller protein
MSRPKRSVSALLSVLLLAGCGHDPVPSTPDGGFGPPRERVFVAANGSAQVHVFDFETLEPVTTIDVGAGAAEVHAVPDGSLVWVVSGTANTVSFIDPHTLDVVRTVDVGARPVHSFLSPDRTAVWVGNDASADVSIIDLQSFDERRVLTGEGHHKMAFVVDDVNTLVATYVSNIIDGTISVVAPGAADGSSALYQVGDATAEGGGVGPSPHGMDSSYANGRVYNCSGDAAHSIEVIATEFEAVEHAIVDRIPLPSRCTYLRVSSNADFVFATLPGDDLVARVRISDAHVDTFATGASPDRFELGADVVYVAHVGEPTLGVVSLDGSPLRTIAVGNAVDPDGEVEGHRGLERFGGRIFVPNAFDGTVTVIDEASETVVATLSGIDAPSGIAIAGPDGGTPYPR